MGIPRQRCNLQNVAHDPETGTRIAIGLFGLLRYNSTMANFERFLLEPLLNHRPEPYTVDVFLHTNVVSRLTNPRTKEVGAELPGPLEWTGFAPCRYTLEDQSVLDIKLAKHKKALRRERKRDLYEDGGASLENLLRALYSLKETSHLIEARESQLGVKYHTVVSVRVDAIFTREVPGDIYHYVRRSPVAKLFVPHFGCSINQELLMNDRFAIGAREAMLEIYLTRLDTFSAINTTVDAPKKAGLSGERHLFNTIRARRVPTARLNQICLRRVRAGGQIWVKVFTSVDERTCPLERVDFCDQECMRETPRCVAGKGCQQRGIHLQTRFFDGEAWCNDPNAKPPHKCAFDYQKLGFDS